LPRRAILGKTACLYQSSSVIREQIGLLRSVNFMRYQALSAQAKINLPEREGVVSIPQHTKPRRHQNARR
jgi:hypothetical protein